MKKLKILIIGIGALMMANLLILDFIRVKQKKIPVSKPSHPPEELPTATPTIMRTEVTPPEGCSKDCVSYIDQKITEAINSLPTRETVKETVVQTKETTTGSKVVYVTIGGSSSTNSTDWADVSGTDFYFDLTDYPTAEKRIDRQLHQPHDKVQSQCGSN